MDPLIINSFSVTRVGAGYVDAVTDPHIGCFFVFDSANANHPLNGFPTVPLGLFYDQWFSTTNGFLRPMVSTTNGFCDNGGRCPLCRGWRLLLAMAGVSSVLAVLQA